MHACMHIRTCTHMLAGWLAGCPLISAAFGRTAVLDYHTVGRPEYAKVESSHSVPSCPCLLLHSSFIDDMSSLARSLAPVAPEKKWPSVTYTIHPSMTPALRAALLPSFLHGRDGTRRDGTGRARTLPRNKIIMNPNANHTPPYKRLRTYLLLRVSGARDRN